jgi:hypothetical protein
MAEIHEYLKIKWPLCAGVGMKERGSFVDPSQMRMGSCHACKGTGKVWALDQQEMAARIAALEAEVKALREKLARMSAPVSDEEFIKHCSLIWIQGEDTQGLLFERDDVDALLAARTADTKEEPKP